MEERRRELTRFGRILTAMMAERGVPGLSALLRLSQEAGYEVDEVAIRTEMYRGTERGRMYLSILDGPAHVLGLSTQESRPCWPGRPPLACSPRR
jgi:hypothetical protein